MENENEKFFRKDLQEQLINGALEVTFTKINGDKRVMNCTLNSAVVPQTEKTTETKKKKLDENLLSVWDTDANGWRSFKIDSIIGVKLIKE